MIENKFNNIKIAAVAAAVPNNYVELDKIDPEDTEVNIEKLKKTTGIKSRYYVSFEQTASDLAFAAAEALLTEKRVDKRSIGAVVFVSQNPDYINPATACVLQYRLGLSEDCMAFDINLGCSGYVYGLAAVAGIMQNANIEKALLLVGDTLVKERNPEAKVNISNTHKYLFGDAAAATLLEKAESGSGMYCGFKTDGSGFKTIITPWGGWRHPDKAVKKIMDEVGVFNFSINRVPEMINEYFNLYKKSADDFDCLVLHQANLMMMRQIARRTGFPGEKLLISLDEYANTSSASIPLTLAKCYGEENEGREISCLMSGFGIGLSWGIADVLICDSDILPVVTTGEFFDDGFSCKQH